MRYDKNITLLKTESNQFDYETGNSVDKLVEVGKFMANVNGVGLENEKLIFGTVGNDNLVLGLRGLLKMTLTMLGIGKRLSCKVYIYTQRRICDIWK